MLRGLRLVAGLLLGFFSGLAGLLVVVFARPAAQRFAGWDRRRISAFLDIDSAEPTRPQAVRYLAVRALVGLFGGFVLAWLFYGIGLGVIAAQRIVVNGLDGIELGDDLAAVAWTALIGGVLLYIEVQGLIGVAALEAKVARRYLGPSEAEVLRKRIDELAESRAGIVAAVDAERRRIERDLHDGVQQRLVALGMLLGRARRHPEHAEDLLGQAHDESRHVLEDLREVAWRVYPAALDALGLADALEAVADRSAIPVEIHCGRTSAPKRVQTAVYFVVSEAVTNAAKHSGATMISVDITGDGGAVRVRIEDDGVGGADPAGGGLAGLSRRVLALDGRFGVHSPVGGPTVITAELPCG
ncbi:signal transduction histidine kinase [Saccharothrix tamanrassetensis]|uniref:histidine kinase n=1 Tax=Saccharothrix tamanrassetensis TaxID=1051531 RepID=A0A841CGA3_9PSEU|nr:sensor histidine kinase [Saccharothrix tamanrassetensis]MBB5957552.1 signal transduction histidine kinase [Saccharothrix tamanrassetensis]